mmetsp:Transcript_1589/g.2810  ORF Transcript_1589/g.2810 Transcript_1589/m.2810 type:complete len:302 (-) Transcript_1589:18-923(-)
MLSVLKKGAAQRVASTASKAASKKLSTTIEQVFVRRPPPNFALGLTTPAFGKPSNTDYGQALRQWLRYVEVFERRGIPAVSLPPLDQDCPDAVFVEDTCVLFKDKITGEDVAVVCENMARERRPEVETMKEALLKQGFDNDHRPFDRIGVVDGEGEMLDGGDVLKCPVSNKVYVGLSSRSNRSGVDKLASLLPNHEVIGVPVTKVLHLKSCITALPDGRIIGYDPLVDDVDIFGGANNYLSVPEEGGAHVVILDDKTLLVAASAPRTADILDKEGYDLEIVDIEQFEKLEGCVTCLSVRRR